MIGRLLHLVLLALPACLWAPAAPAADFGAGRATARLVAGHDASRPASARLLKGCPAGTTIGAITMKIDLYAIDIGGGHLAPAHAIKRQFDLLHYPDLEVRVINLGRALRMRASEILVCCGGCNWCFSVTPCRLLFGHGA